MKKKIGFKIKSKHLLAIMTCACISAIALTATERISIAPLRNAVGMLIVPIQNGINAVGSYLTDLQSGFQNVQQLAQENEDLQVQVDSLTEQNSLLLQSQQELQRLQDDLEHLAKERAAACGLSLSIRYCDMFPNTVSHPASNRKIRAVCRKLGIPVRELPAPHRSSEDFGYYTRMIPGAFFEIGSGEACPELHTVGMDFPDAIIETAVAIFHGLIDQA